MAWPHRSSFAKASAVTALVLLGSCGETREPLDYRLLATDVRVVIADKPVVLPLIALSGYTNRGRDFRINWETESKREYWGLAELQRRSVSWSTALHLDQVAIGVGTHGWSDFDARAREVCPRLPVGRSDFHPLPGQGLIEIS